MGLKIECLEQGVFKLKSSMLDQGKYYQFNIEICEDSVLKIPTDKMD